MAQIKIEITYDPSTETLAQAVSSLVPKASASAVMGGQLEKTPAPTAKPESKDKPAGPTTAATGETAATAPTEGKAATGAANDQPDASHSDPKPEKKVSKTDVRAIATALSKAGKREQLSAIFAEFGGKKLSDIKEEDYPALMEKLEAANG